MPITEEHDEDSCVVDESQEVSLGMECNFGGGDDEKQKGRGDIEEEYVTKNTPLTEEEEESNMNPSYLFGCDDLTTDDDDDDAPSDETTSKKNDVDETPKDDDDGGKTSNQSRLRTGWEWTHRLLGVVLIALAWYNCHTGIEWQIENWEEGEESKNWIGVFWGITIGISGTIFVMTYVMKYN